MRAFTSAPRAVFSQKFLRSWTRCYASATQEELERLTARERKLKEASLSDAPLELDALACMISTLNPTLLTSRDYLDVSHRRSIRPSFTKSQQSPVPAIHYDMQHKIRKPVPFPGECRGFLYYHRDERAAPLEGSLRFRRTPTDAPSSFGSGTDLLSHSGAPWQLILPQLSISWPTEYQKIRHQLLEEKLVTPDQVSRCQELFGKGPRIVPQLTLFRLTQEFPVNFNTPGLNFTVVGEDALHKAEYILFNRKNHMAWSGSGIVRFEPSTSDEHVGRRVLHLRIVRLLTPISSVVNREEIKRLIVKPEKGQLLMLLRDNAPVVWAYDIDLADGKTGIALRALWEVSHTSSDSLGVYD
ncbi:hypothetical protein K438DRAFT_2024560 [Mycena galopus ATCC 62051]|nr:hypothetical protein K438DRAFT_2024560 [Mycena galopus ATCC 62051]